MTSLIDPSSREAAGSVAALVLAGLLVLVSAAAIFVSPLLIWAASLDHAARWWWTLWLVGTAAVLLFNFVRAVAVVRQPHLRDLGAPALVSALSVIACPLWFGTAF